MSTDQIQKALFERSDKETKAAVDGALDTLRKWHTTRGFSANVKVVLGAGTLKRRDGTQFPSDLTPQDYKNYVTQGGTYVAVPLAEVIKAVAEAMFAHVQTKDREAYVQQFVNDVERLRGEVEELHDRVSSVENQ